MKKQGTLLNAVMITEDASECARKSLSTAQRLRSPQVSAGFSFLVLDECDRFGILNTHANGNRPTATNGERVMDEGHRSSKIPDHMRASVKRYLEEGGEVGGFLMAVLCNNLSGAFARADQTNREALGDWVSWLWNDCPSDAWGSLAEVRAWQRTHSRYGHAIGGK